MTHTITEIVLALTSLGMLLALVRSHNLASRLERIERAITPGVRYSISGGREPPRGQQ